MTTTNKRDATERAGAILKDIDAHADRAHAEQRVGKLLDPPAEEGTLPESISAGEVLPNVPDYTRIKLKAVPLRGLKYFLITLLFTLLLYAGVEVRATFIEAMHIHWILGVLFVGLVSMFTAAGLYLLWGLLAANSDEKIMAEVGNHAADIRLQHDCGAATALFERLDALYQNKPQNIHWQACKESIPDYSDDREALAHIERLFMRRLDAEAERRISRDSALIGVAVAASPWVSMDMILSFWRNLNMIVDVAQVYGVRPSLRNRLQLIRRVLNHMASSGATELAVQQLVQDIGGQATLGAVSVRLAQGIGVGIYSAKIGIAAMHTCRPIAFEEGDAPALSDIAVQLKKRMMS